MPHGCQPGRSEQEEQPDHWADNSTTPRAKRRKNDEVDEASLEQARESIATAKLFDAPFDWMASLQLPCRHAVFSIEWRLKVRARMSSEETGNMIVFKAGAAGA